jgi:hypothetical protein
MGGLFSCVKHGLKWNKLSEEVKVELEDYLNTVH